jgi:hypothetical protein
MPIHTLEPGSRARAYREWATQCLDAGEFVQTAPLHEQAVDHTERFTEKEAAPGGSGGKPLEAWSPAGRVASITR